MDTGRSHYRLVEKTYSDTRPAMDQLRKLLAEKAVRESLRSTAINWKNSLIDLIRFGQDLSNAIDEKGYALARPSVDPYPGGADLADFVSCFAGGEFGQNYRAEIDKQIIQKLERPLICTLDDLSDAFVEHFLDLSRPSQTFDDKLAEFERAVAIQVIHRSSEPMPVYRGPYFVSETVMLWDNKNGARIKVVGALPLTSHGFSNHHCVYVTVTARCTERALAFLASEAVATLGTAFRCIDNTTPEVPPPDPVQITPADLLGEFRLLPAALDAVFTNQTKKESIDRRIRNAIHLLVESDRQVHPAVGLAIAVGAIEAMVGRKGEGLAALFADNVAVMLEPDLDKRANAVKFAKRIYDLRSQVLHGTAVEGEVDIRDQARRVASGMLKAMIERRDFLRRAGFDPESPDDLLKSIRDAKFRPGLPEGVSESPVRILWNDRCQTEIGLTLRRKPPGSK